MPLKVLLVYPQFPTSYWGMHHALRLFGKKTMHSPLGLITVAALCPKEWEYKLIDLNIETLRDEAILWADLVFTSAMGVQWRSLYQVLQRCRDLKRTSVLGGPFASGITDRVLGRADVLVLDEAEITIKPFLEDLASGNLQPMYRTTEKPDLTTSPVPRYDLLKLDAYSVIDVQYSRGCPFNCEFCDIIELYGRVPRTKTPAQVIAEFEALRKLDYKGPVFLVDDNFIGNKKNVRLLLKELIPYQKKHQYPFFLTTEASVNLADDAPLLKDMREAGFRRVFLGIETPSMEGLRETQKYQNTRRELTSAVQEIIDSGLEVTGGFIVGFDSDTDDIFDRQSEFIRKAPVPWAMVGTLAAVPSTQLWDRLEREGRLTGYPDGDQFGRPNFQTKMDPEVLHNGYVRLLDRLYQPDVYYERVLDMIGRLDKANHPNLHAKTKVPLPPLQVAKVFYELGIKSHYRASFWKFLLKLLWKHPRRFGQGMLNAVVGHHFIQYTQEVINRDREVLPFDSESQVNIARKKDETEVPLKRGSLGFANQELASS